MAYTRPAYNAANVTWIGEQIYTRPAYNAADVTWLPSSQPIQGTINWIGQTPKLKLQPDNQAFQGVINWIGQIPTAVLGFAGTPTVGSIDIIGQTPILQDWSEWRAYQSTIEITGNRPTFAFLKANQGTIEITGQTPRLVFGFVRPPIQGQINWVGQTPTYQNRREVALPNYWLSTHYRCYLTGTSDLELPLKSIQIRYSKDPDYRVYASIVVPGLADFQADITARQSGRLKIYRIYNLADGSTESFLMANVPFSSIRSDEGPRAGRTGTLSGNELVTDTPDALSIALQDPMYRAEQDGILRYRAALDPRVRPGDSVTINGDSFVVRTITNIIDASTCIMEIAE